MVDQSTALLLSAAIGAGSAVTTQIIAATVTQRSASKRFTWERETTARREASERHQRFLDVKRELFASFLAGHMSLHDQMMELSRRRKPLRVLRARKWIVDSRVEAVSLQEIVLIAPDLLGVCRDVDNAAWRARLTAIKGRGAPTKEMLSEYRGAVLACRKAMSAHLAG